jgi:hypothetical protein
MNRTVIPRISIKELNRKAGTWQYIEFIVHETHVLLEKNPALYSKVTTYQDTLMILQLIYPGPDIGVFPGGFITLIQEGFGEYIFESEFGGCLKEWGFNHLASIIERANKIYQSKKVELESQTHDYEVELSEYYAQYPELGKLGEEFGYYMGDEAEYIIEFVKNNIEYFAIVV